MVLLYPRLIFRKNRKKAETEKEFWQMPFLEFAKEKWGDFWMVGHRRMDAKEYHGNVGRQITHKDYQTVEEEYVQAVRQALSEGKPVSEEVLRDCKFREKIN
jgi:hypothetical protein